MTVQTGASLWRHPGTRLGCRAALPAGINMRHGYFLTLICAIWLAVAACALQPTRSPAPAALPPAASPPGSREPATPPVMITRMDDYLSLSSRVGSFAGAALVARGGKVPLSQGYGLADRQRNIPNTPTTRFRLASITKQFTATAILMLQAQGKLQVQDLACDYLPDCPAAWNSITIHQLLTHTSGIPNYTGASGCDSDLPTPFPPGQALACFKNLPLRFPPGERWDYSNSGYIVLGEILERVSGQSYAAFLQQSIFQPLHMPDSGYARDAGGLAPGYANSASQIPAEWGYGGADGRLYSTVEDLYRWDRALYSAALLPQGELAQMFAPYADCSSAFKGMAYGYGWYTGEYLGRRLVMHEGSDTGARTIILRYPDEQAVIILLSNQRSSNVRAMAWQLSNMLFGE